MSTDLVALDPSVRSPGVALFRERVLIFAGKVSIPKVFPPAVDWKSEGSRWQIVAECIVKWCSERDVISPGIVIYERPQIYTMSKSKGDPNDLIALAAIGAAVVSHYCTRGGRPDILTPTPAEWCGQIPKATKGSAKESPRAKRILSRLSPEELKLVPNQHDSIDAVGLGLFALGRLGVKRVYSTGA